MFLKNFPRTSPYSSYSPGSNKTPADDAQHYFETISDVGYEAELELSSVCDQGGFVWVHERCAAWTLASIASSSAQGLMDISSKLLSKVSLSNEMLPWTILTNSALVATQETAPTCLGFNLPLAQIIKSDRKSTRLNSSHANISYAVFCLKKKNFIVF